MIDRRNAILILLVLLFVGIVGFWLPFQRSTHPSPVPSSQKSADVTVEYQEGGFVPETITVSIGSTVAWQNSVGRPMWVASDPHPAHTDLEGFDQQRVINRVTPPFSTAAHAHGEGIYEYTFTKPGIWKYHNHLSPQHRGTITVVDE